MSFSDASALEPVYTLATNYKLALAVINLTLRAVGNATCTDALATMDLTVEPSATAIAGSDDGVCSDENYVLSGASATNYASVSWATDGDGTFDTSTDQVKATYIPGATDKLGATVRLTLTAVGNLPCGNASNFMDLLISPSPTADAGGDATICSYDTYDFTGISDATNYASLAWTTSGDGSFSDASALEPVYTLGTNDKLGLAVITL
ncbi:MAG: hypothetical protein GY679_04135, partial [Mycoplasma sp.]|nr:hypothetical protein [Mycoplasma sp.]